MYIQRINNSEKQNKTVVKCENNNYVFLTVSGFTNLRRSINITILYTIKA